MYCPSGASNVRGDVGIARELEHGTLALDLCPGAIIGGIECVAIADLEVTRCEVNLAGGGTLAAQRHKNRVAIGTSQGRCLRIFDSDNVQVVVSTVGRAIAVFGKGGPR